MGVKLAQTRLLTFACTGLVFFFMKSRFDWLSDTDIQQCSDTPLDLRAPKDRKLLAGDFRGNDNRRRVLLVQVDRCCRSYSPIFGEERWVKEKEKKTKIDAQRILFIVHLLRLINVNARFLVRFLTLTFKKLYFRYWRGHVVVVAQSNDSGWQRFRRRRRRRRRRWV